MDRLTSFLSAVRPYRDGDFVDRLNSVYTVLMLMVCAVVVSGWSFVGSPIQCWFPAYFKGWWIQYSLDYCYVQNTYFVPFTNVTPAKNYWDLISSPVLLPESVQEREDRLIGYYQWVPFILALIALCFYFPIVLWRALNKHTGISVKTVCETTCILNNVEEESRKTNTGKVARLLDHSKVLSESLYGRTFANGRYISTLYLVCKTWFFLNAVVQFLLLQVFLGVSDHLWGYRVTKNLLNGVQWEETGHFPRVTVCDFEVRELGNLHRHSVQCVLMINMFNEKIFMLIWWWFLVLMFINGFSLIEWMIVILVEPLNVRLVRDYLSTLKHPPLSAKETELYLREFIHYCLRSDGTFLLRLVSTNSGDAVCRDMVEYLWNQFLNRKQRRTLSDLGHSPLPCAPYDAPSPDDTLPLEHTYSGDEEGVQNQSKFRENAKESTL